MEGSIKVTIGTGSSNFNSFPNIELKVDGKYWSIPDIAKDFDKKFDMKKLMELMKNINGQGNQGGQSGQDGHNSNPSEGEPVDPATYANEGTPSNDDIKKTIYKSLSEQIVSMELSLKDEEESYGKDEYDWEAAQNKILEETSKRTKDVENVNDFIKIWNKSTSNIGNVVLQMILNEGIASEYFSRNPGANEDTAPQVWFSKSSYSNVANNVSTANKGWDITIKETEKNKKEYEKEHASEVNTEDYKGWMQWYDNKIEQSKNNIEILDKVSSANALMISGAVLLPIFAIVMGLGIAGLVMGGKSTKTSIPTPTAE